MKRQTKKKRVTIKKHRRGPLQIAGWGESKGCFLHREKERGNPVKHERKLKDGNNKPDV